MKKLLIILLLTGCTKVTPTPQPIANNTSIFSVARSSVNDGDNISFDLKYAGTYTLTMGDSTTNQVLTRERFIGKTGTNNLKIYTRSLSVKYLYLILEDSTKKQVGKTTIVIN
jgi:hypothetical protein